MQTVHKFIFYFSTSSLEGHNVPLSATLVSTVIWIFNFFLCLVFAISPTEITALNKAMGAYLCGSITILLRQPCMTFFAFRIHNTENRRLDKKAERERRRAIVIEEAKQERALRKQNLEAQSQIEEV